jgi:hypothetical protein
MDGICRDRQVASSIQIPYNPIDKVIILLPETEETEIIV